MLKCTVFIEQSHVGEGFLVEGPNPQDPVQVVEFVQVIHGYTHALVMVKIKRLKEEHMEIADIIIKKIIMYLL